MYFFLVLMFMLGAIPLESADREIYNVYNATSGNLIFYNYFSMGQYFNPVGDKILKPGWGRYSSRYHYFKIVKGDNVKDIIGGISTSCFTKGTGWENFEDNKILLVGNDPKDPYGLKTAIISKDECEKYISSINRARAVERAREIERKVTVLAGATIVGAGSGRGAGSGAGAVERKVIAEPSSADAGAGAGVEAVDSAYSEREAESGSSIIQISNITDDEILIFKVGTKQIILNHGEMHDVSKKLFNTLPETQEIEFFVKNEDKNRLVPVGKKTVKELLSTSSITLADSESEEKIGSCLIFNR